MTAVLEDQRVRRQVWWTAAAVVVGVALAVRWVGITLAPLAFQPHRQLTDATMARGYWLHLGGHLPPGLPEGYTAWVPRALEPPLLQGAGALVYVFGGGERLWLVRALIAAGWVVTALAVWGLVRRLTDRVGGAVAVGVWLFAPYLVTVSRAFLPDVAMLCLVVVALWAMVRAATTPDRPRAWTWACVAGAGAVLVKPTAAAAVVPVLLVLAWAGGGRALVLSRRTVCRLAAVLGPAAVYWVVLSATGLLDGQQEGRVDLSVLGTMSFWRGWLDMAQQVLPLPVVALGLVGLLLAPRLARLVGAALLAGYLVHGLAFAHHTPTHDYYHLFLVPPVLVGLGALASWLVTWVDRRDLDLRVMAPAAIGALAVLLLAGPRPYPYIETSLPASVAAVPGQAEEVGAFVDHAEPVLLVSRAYGIAQQYYGWLKGPFWPLEADLAGEEDGAAPSAAERLEGLESPDDLATWGVADGPIDWVVVTEPLILEQQPDLAALLSSDFDPVGSGPGWSAWHRR